MIHFAIVDDHPLVRKALIDILHKTKKFLCILEADNGNAFIDSLSNKSINLILLDLMMPGKNGMDTFGWLQQHHPSLKVVFMSFYQDKPSIEKLLALGADGYISKAWDFEKILEVLEGIMATPKQVKIPKRTKYNIAETELVITEREKDLLALSTSDLTYEEMANTLHISLKTVDKHRSSLFKKLNVKSRAGLVVNAIKLGMIKWWE